MVSARQLKEVAPAKVKNATAIGPIYKALYI